MALRLITIPISHFCDKARWALERARLVYVEEAHLQGLHYPYALWAGGGITVPVLVHPGGALCESSDILRWVDNKLEPERRLYPDELRAEVEALERRFDDELGPATRLYAYHELLDHPELLKRYGLVGVPAWQERAVALAFRAIRPFLRARYAISTESAVEARGGFLRLMDEVARRLGDGRRYLCGDRFTAADLAFAALSAPVVLPDEYGVRLPRVDELPPSYALVVHACRAHPAGAFALRMYREERRMF